LGLPRWELDDVRQDLLVDLLDRLPAFDPGRGTLGAFAGTVLAHQAGTIARRVTRERRLYDGASASLHERHDAEQQRCKDTIAEGDGLPALLGHPVDAFGAAERRMDLERCLQYLDRQEAQLCRSLLASDDGVASLSESGARATRYRRLRSI